MLTFLCSPKPFTGEAAWNQLNALRSWRAIAPNVQIFVFGAPEGAAEAASEVGAVIVPEVVCSLSGAPSFNFMVSHAHTHGVYDLQVYANCDMLFDGSLVQAMQQAQARFRRFLLVGERLDLAQRTQVDVRDTPWIRCLPTLVANSQLAAHGPTGADYFGYARGIWDTLPPVFMGRAICDQALLHYCFLQRIPVVSATLAVTAVHQYHGYGHVRGGEREVFRGADTAEMAAAHGLKYALPTIADADWELLGHGRIEPRNRGLLRSAELKLRYRYNLGRAALGFRALRYLGGRRRITSAMLPAESILESWLTDTSSG